MERSLLNEVPADKKKTSPLTERIARPLVVALILVSLLIAVTSLTACSAVKNLKLGYLPDRIVKGDFFTLGLTVDVDYGSSAETVYIDREMFSEEDLLLLETTGKHTVTLRFGGKTADFSVEIVPEESFSEGDFSFRFLTGGGVALVSFDAEGMQAVRAIIPEEAGGEKVKRIDARAFMNSVVNYVYLPETVGFIGSEAFYGCKNLEYFYIPKSVERVEKAVFNGGGQPFLRVLEIDNPDLSFDEEFLLGCSDELTVFAGDGELKDFLVKKGGKIKENLNLLPEVKISEPLAQLESRFVLSDGSQREIRFGEKDISVYNTYKLYWAVMLGFNPVAEKDSPADKLLTAVKSAVCSVTDENMTEEEKLIAVYEFICRETSENDDVDETSPLNHYAFLPEGVFFAHSAVCDGYAKAFNLMARAVGVCSERATGYYTVGSRKVYHAWNRVFTGGNWYETDVSRGDINRGFLSGGKEYTTHFYLLCGSCDSENVSSDGISVELSDRTDWYSRYGLIIRSQDELNSFVERHKEQLLSGERFELLVTIEISYENSLMSKLIEAFSLAEISGMPDVRFLLNHPDGGGVYLLGVAE